MYMYMYREKTQSHQNSGGLLAFQHVQFVAISFIQDLLLRKV